VLQHKKKGNSMKYKIRWLGTHFKVTALALPMLLLLLLPLLPLLLLLLPPLPPLLLLLLLLLWWWDQYASTLDLSQPPPDVAAATASCHPQSCLCAAGFLGDHHGPKSAIHEAQGGKTALE
jgi:hypothetical protein